MTNVSKYQKNYDYKMWNLLDYSYQGICYKLIGIDLSRETNPEVPQKIDFLGKLDPDISATMFFFYLDSLNVAD